MMEVVSGDNWSYETCKDPVMEVVSGDNWSYETCKDPVTINKPAPSFLQAGCPSCHPINRVEALTRNRARKERNKVRT